MLINSAFLGSPVKKHQKASQVWQEQTDLEAASAAGGLHAWE